MSQTPIADQVRVLLEEDAKAGVLVAIECLSCHAPGFVSPAVAANLTALTCPACRTVGAWKRVSVSD